MAEAALVAPPAMAEAALVAPSAMAEAAPRRAVGNGGSRARRAPSATTLVVLKRTLRAVQHALFFGLDLLTACFQTSASTCGGSSRRSP